MITLELGASETGTLEQVKYVIARMPIGTEVEHRDRALIAFVLLTGARDGAVAPMQLRHVNVMDQSVFQDAKVVKNQEQQDVYFVLFPCGR